MSSLQNKCSRVVSSCKNSVCMNNVDLLWHRKVAPFSLLSFGGYHSTTACMKHWTCPPRLSRPKNMHNRWQIWITWWQIENWYRTASPYRREYVLELTYLFLFLHNMLSSEWDTCNVVDVVIEVRTQTLKYLMSFWWNIILVSGRISGYL